MTPYEFLRNLKLAVSGIPESEVKRAGLEYLGSLAGRTATQADVESVALTCQRAGPTTPIQMDTPIGAFHLRDLMASETIAERFESHMHALRRQLFGGEGRPFRSTKAARRWIVETARAEKEGLPELKDSFSQAMQQVNLIDRDDNDLRILEISRSTGVEVSRITRVKPAYLPCPPGSKKDRGSVFAPFGKKLHRLTRGVERIAQDTGFPAAAVTWWVLLGVRPVLPRLTFTVHGLARRTWAEVKFNAIDLRWEELRELYRRLRTVANVRLQRVNPLHYRIWQIVRGHGGVPDAGKGAFWEGIRRQLREEGATRIPGTWHAIRKAYLEIEKSGFAEHTRGAPLEDDRSGSGTAQKGSTSKKVQPRTRRSRSASQRA